MASKEVAEHYNGVRQEGIGGRTESRIFYQRNLSNWIKSQLIDETMNYLRTVGVYQPRVMDLACGKGGDLKKWKIARAKSVVMADVASVSINQAKERYEENKIREGQHTWFPAQFIVADCCNEDINEKITDKTPFDIVSCQFALHYSFINEESARRFIRNATQSLSPGGYFIGTLPNAERIVWAGRENNGEFSNDVCKVRFENKDELIDPPLFGCKFHFTLDSQVNCPEFLAYFPLLTKLLDENEMDLVMVKRFPDAIDRWQEKGRGLMGKMQALEPYPASQDTKLAGSEDDYERAKQFLTTLDPNDNQHVGTLSRGEWEAVCMYLVFIFRKRGGPDLAKAEENRRRKLEENRETRDSYGDAPEVKRSRNI